MENIVLTILLNRDKWNIYRRHIPPSALSSISNLVLDHIDQYFSRFPAVSVIDLGKFSTWVLFSAPIHLHAELRALFESMDGLVVSIADEQMAFSAVNRRDFATRIVNHALEVADGKSHTLDPVEHLLEEYNEQTGRIAMMDKWFVNTDLTELLSAKSVGKGLEWRLQCLRKSLGPLRKGDLMAFGARVGAGKTTMLASEVSYMAQQLATEKKYVLWVNLEERGSKVKRRIIQAALGWSNAKLLKDPAETMKAYLDLYGGYDPIRLLDKADCSTGEVSSALKRSGDYGLIVIDMVSKLHGYTTRGDETTRQGLLFNWARETSKTYAPLITVAQLSGDAEGVEYPTMGMIYFSRTAMQAELDALVMIGKSNDPTREYERYLGVVKNKAEDVDNKFRNGRFIVELKPDIARYEEYLLPPSSE